MNMIRVLRVGIVAIVLGLMSGLALAQPAEPEAPGEEVVVTPDEDEVASPESPADPEVKESRKERRARARRDRNAGDPCRIANTVEDAWIDRLQSQLHASVCNSAVWFDHFFGQGEVVDSEEFFGYVGVGLLYKTHGEWDDQSRFDANIPMPNLNKRLNLFVGRGDEDDIVSDRTSAVAEPVAPFQESAGESWLAGFGYSPPGKGGQRLVFRIGGKVSSDPYAFGQVRWRFNYFPSDQRAIRIRQTLFYRTNDDGFGSTTALALDKFMKDNLMGRASASVTFSEDERGVDWKSFLTVYHDMSQRWGRVRGAAYQYFIRGYTDQKVTVPEYGLRATYRQQMFRPYLFGEASVGYSWEKDDDDGRIENPERDGSWNFGFVMEIRFGSPRRQENN
jgi:hypothetical protein